MFFSPVWLISVMHEMAPAGSRDMNQKWKKENTTVYQYAEGIGKKQISLQSYNLDRSSTKKVYPKDHKQLI